MHFNDLDPCRYSDGAFDPGHWRVPLLAVGWLEASHPFTRGAAPRLLARRLRTLNRRFAEEIALHSFLGLHACTICTASGLPAVDLPGSSSNLFVPGDARVFVAPGRIDHYVDRHSYLPPADFIDAVFRCPDPRSSEYARALRAANADTRPPLFSMRAVGRPTPTPQAPETVPDTPETAPARAPR
jgi:hypothetical protein